MRNFLLLLLFFALSSHCFSQTLKNNSSNGLNLRNEPSTSASIITSIPPRGKVTVIDKSNSEWYHVRYNGKTGYVSARYLSDENSSSDKTNKQSSSARTSQKRQNNGGAAAVSYNTGIGVRFGGWESGLSIKHFIRSNTAIEGILSSGWYYRGTRRTGLYEIQKPITGANGLYWFYGVGGHLGFHNREYWSKGPCNNGFYEHKGRLYRCDTNRATIGVDGIIGLEYLFQEIPITFGLDFKPSIDIIGWGGSYGDLAFTIRYAF